MLAGAKREVPALVGRVWPRLPAALTRAQSWGVDWCDLSTAFVHTLDGEVVAHVGVLEIPVMLAGQPTTLAGVHAVCSAPQVRGRGHVRELLDRALGWIDSRGHALTVLWANDPAVYRNFGFREHEESIFIAPVARREPRPSGSSLRTLDLANARDLAFVHDRLARRIPVSSEFGARHDGTPLHLLDLALWQPGPRLAWLPELECMVVYAVRERFLDLYDLVAERMPTLAEVAERIDPRIETAVVYFSPDALGAEFVAEATTLADVFMVRGDWPLDQPFALSPLSRC